MPSAESTLQSDPLLPLLPTLSVAQGLAQRLGDPSLSVATVDALATLGVGLFDLLDWDARTNEDSARPDRRLKTVWQCANETWPGPACERLATHLDARLEQEPESGLGMALGHWFEDDWDIGAMVERERPREQVVWALTRALASVRRAPGSWPHPAMLARCPVTLDPHPHADRLSPDWLSPLGRSLVQGLMLWVSRRLQAAHACELIEACVDAGVPLIAWDTRWQHEDPRKRGLGVGRTNAPFRLHLAGNERWTVIVWWLAHLPSPWRVETVIRPAGVARPVSEVTQDSLVHQAWAQSVGKKGGDGMTLYKDTNVNESRLFVIREGLNAAMAGDPDAQTAFDHGLLDEIRTHLRQNGNTGWDDGQQAALYEACVAYEQVRLRTSLPPEATRTLPGAGRRRL